MDDALLGGRYRLGEELGKGGMAWVVRAFDTRLSRDCAVKILSADLRADPAYVARFLDDVKKVYWALCVPMTPIMFYGSDPFYQMLEDANEYDCSCGLTTEEQRSFKKKKLEHFCSFILRRFYDIQFKGSGSIVRSMIDPQTGIPRHYRLNLNTDFINITPKRPLPEVNL